MAEAIQVARTAVFSRMSGAVSARITPMGYKAMTMQPTGHPEASVTVATIGDLTSVSVQDVPVDRIRPEDGLARKRDREGHQELQRSIKQFGVLTPITVRPAPDSSGDFLLIKGQGRTLACRLLGIAAIPAIVVDSNFAEDEKVQQFLVENVARLKMRPVDRALLVHRARQAGEETSGIAKRFGLSAVTVRRLLAQLEDVTQSEVAALRAGDVNLAVHAVIARHVGALERAEVITLVASSNINAKDLESVFGAIGWQQLAALGASHTSGRLALLAWVCGALDKVQGGSIKERFRRIASQMPAVLGHIPATISADGK
jgi:ParB/RepB/Spo0J family partition protein